MNDYYNLHWLTAKKEAVNEEGTFL